MAPIGSARAGLLGSGIAIPDSDILHARYDARELSLSDQDAVNTFPDEEESFDLGNGTAPTYVKNAINGNPVVRFDGEANYLNNTSISLSQPVHVFIVGGFHSSPDGTFFDGVNNNFRILNSGGSDWRMDAGTNLTDGSTDQDNHIFGALFDGANSDLRIDGLSAVSGDAGSNSLDGLQLGAFNQVGSAVFAPFDFGEILIYNGEPTVSDVEQYLEDGWGPIL